MGQGGFMPERWVGIDEAGYGPNLGPLVFTAIVADGERPNLWLDRARTVCRAGGDPRLLWVDDSKRLHRPNSDLNRLTAATLAALAATGLPELPSSLSGLFECLGIGTFDHAELSPWLPDGRDPIIDRSPHETILALRPLEGDRWRILTVQSIVIGPRRFNAELEATGSKASVHFQAFSELLLRIWNSLPDGTPIHIQSDKHGGRHFYLDMLMQIFPGLWIDRGPEGPAQSCYTIRDGRRRLELHLRPKADADDGLVALASIVSKLVRESWMGQFNAFWARQLPGLKPTAGYPADSRRFRAEIEPHCPLDPSLWWRSK